jgi:hypothetical protein
MFVPANRNLNILDVNPRRMQYTPARSLGSLFVPRQRVFAGGVKYRLCLAVFRDLLTRWIHDTRPSLVSSHCPLNLFVFNPITSAWSTRRSAYSDICYKTEAPLKSMRCSALLLCYATAEFSCWSSCMCLLRSVHLASVVPPLCPTYTLLQVHRIRYIYGTFRSKLSTYM